MNGLTPEAMRSRAPLGLSNTALGLVLIMGFVALTVCLNSRILDSFSITH